MTTHYITVAEFCAQFRIGKTKAYELLNARMVRSKKVGRKTLLDVASVEAWENTLPERESTSDPLNGEER